MLKGKKALVTGSSRGIGRKIVEIFLKNGAEVWGLCSKPSKAKDELENFAKENASVFHEICADVGNVEMLSKTVKDALSEAGNFDILVNNAGITRDGLSFRMKMEDWQNVINVNLTGTFVVTQIVSNAMLKARAGSIINMSSIVGIHGQGGQVNYSASKGGLIAYSKSLAKEVLTPGITIVPTLLFINEKGFCKVKIALCKGKKEFDKRDSIKEKDNKRELDRIMKNY